MDAKRFSQLLSQYQIVAVDDYNQKPRQIYIAKTTKEVFELTEVIAIDLYKPSVYEPQKEGSYAKFMRPIRKIFPEKDNVKEMWKQVGKLPELLKHELVRLMEVKPEVLDEGYLKFYNLDENFFPVIRKNFIENGNLEAFDFFCIIIWKANRAKSKIAEMLLKKFNSLEIASRTITYHISNANLNDYERFKYLLDIGFRLPMLTAILTVLYPERFTVYDYRICSHPEFNEFQILEYKMRDTSKYWCFYQKYIKTVVENTPSWMTLRQKDQYLWGKSFSNQLKKDIITNFKK